MEFFLKKLLHFRFGYAIINKLFGARQYAPLAQLDRASGYGPEGRGFESLTACQKAREIQGFHELFLFSSAFVFPRKWSSRTAIRSGSILPQNTVTAAFACRDGKHDFYACVDQKNHRIFPLPKKLPAKNSDNFAVCGRIGVASVGKKL